MARSFFPALFASLLYLCCGKEAVAPRLGDGSEVDWWFAYKFNSKSYPECSTTRKCIFGGSVQPYKYGYGMQYALASSVGGKTQEMELKTDCLGTGADPVAQTFDQVYSGAAPNYVIWNDQFYREPQVHLDPPCSHYSSDPTSCSAPWGHSKGVLSWDADGNGFIMQVTTPDWPGNGNSNITRETQGNTLGCIHDDNVEVAQHFFSMRLTTADTKAVLQALQRASVVTDPSNPQIVRLSNSPGDLASLAKGLAKLDSNTSPLVSTLSNGAKLIAKPHALNVPPWQMVSAIVGKPLRTATWWSRPEILSSKAGTPGCWSDILGTPQEVQIATSGQFKGIEFSLKGGLGKDHNHAKLAHSLDGSLAIMGDMNQQGSYSPEYYRCSASQNGRGGMFFVLDNPTLHSGLKELMTGSTADYYGSTPTPSSRRRTPTPSSRRRTTPSSSCGGEGTHANSCRTASKKAAGCVYVYASHADECGVSRWGCYDQSSLPPGCPDRSAMLTDTKDDNWKLLDAKILRDVFV